MGEAIALASGTSSRPSASAPVTIAPTAAVLANAMPATRRRTLDRSRAATRTAAAVSCATNDARIRLTTSRFARERSSTANTSGAGASAARAAAASSASTSASSGLRASTPLLSAVTAEA